MCDCDLRWYRQWIDEEWNEIEDEWLKETSCVDPADRQEHNIAEVPLKDMFCTDDVSDKPPRVKVRVLVYSTQSSSTVCNIALNVVSKELYEMVQ